jgi:hypothetical protein
MGALYQNGGSSVGTQGVGLSPELTECRVLSAGNIGSPEEHRMLELLQELTESRLLSAAQLSVSIELRTSRNLSNRPRQYTSDRDDYQLSTAVNQATGGQKASAPSCPASLD